MFDVVMKIMLGLSPVIVCVGGTRGDIYGTGGDLVVVGSKFSDRLWLYPSLGQVEQMNLIMESQVMGYLQNKTNKQKSILIIKPMSI